MKKIFNLLLILILLFTATPNAKAAGATLALTGADTATTGTNFTVTLVVNSLDGATGDIAGIDGKFTYSTDLLEYVSFKNVSTFSTMKYSTGTNKIAGMALDYEERMKTTPAKMIEFTFKPKKAGTATISIQNSQVTAGVALNASEVKKTITITDPVPKSNNAFLSSLSVTGQTLSPAFDKNTLNYTVTVPNSVTSATIKATAEDSKATVTSNGTVNATGLKEGDNKYTITVTAEDKTTKKSYVVTIKREAAPIPDKSGDNDLKSLSVEGQTLSPAFDKGTTKYTLKVGKDVNEIKVNATANDSKATVSGAGTKKLNPGSNTIDIVVKAENGSTKTYQIVVEKEVPAEASKDNTLKNMSVDGYNMTPNFDPNTPSYNVTVPFEADKIIVKTTPNDGKAKVEVIGADNLKVGNNTVEIKVTAENGDVKTYTINVTKNDKAPEVKKDNDATLKSLSVGGGKLNPGFNKNIYGYAIEVGSNVSKIDVNAIPTSGKASVEVTGNGNLKTGMNTVYINVTAEDGSKSTYVINVNKKAASNTTPTKKSNDSTLSNLGVNGAELSPKFNKDNTNYTITVPYDTSKLDIFYNASDGKAKVEIIGNDELQVDKVNTVQIKVTAEDGSVKIYTINATRSAKTSNNKLKTLTVNGETLNPGFDKDIYSYKVTVKSNVDKLDLKALAENDKAKVEIEGNSNFKVGNNTVLIKVTDENGFMRLYQIDVEKKAFTILGMSVGQFFMFLLLGLGLLGILFLLLFLLKKKKDEEPKAANSNTPTPPVIDFKPEFNFGSRNGTDDDVVYPGGTLNQDSTIATNTEVPKKLTDNVQDAYYEELADTIYEDDGILDETITKDELVRAIREGMQTKNTDKLRMLLKQDELNQLRKKIKQDEEKKRRNKY